MRARLEEDLRKLSPTAMLVFTSEDGLLAQVATADALPPGWRDVRYLRGGTKAWIKAGLSTSSGEERMASAAEDIWLRPYERRGDVSGAMAEYLQWEVDLLGMIERDGTTAFKAL